MIVQFELDGQAYVAMNGGSHFKFSEGISLPVECETQAEIDAYCDKLLVRGKQGPCGWLTDRFGVSWQFGRPGRAISGANAGFFGTWREWVQMIVPSGSMRV